MAIGLLTRQPAREQSDRAKHAACLEPVWDWPPRHLCRRPGCPPHFHRHIASTSLHKDQTSVQNEGVCVGDMCMGHILSYPLDCAGICGEATARV